jgi:hypothetical protein
VEDGGGAGDRVGSVRPTASPVDGLGWAVATAAKSRGYDFWGGGGEELRQGLRL